MIPKIQYNKISQLQLEKQLKIRLKALPTLKNKESALRLEVKRARDMAHDLDQRIRAGIGELEEFMKLWAEFDPGLLEVKNVEIHTRKIAGVQVPVLGEIDFQLRDYDLFSAPSWFLDGIALVRNLHPADRARVLRAQDADPGTRPQEDHAESQPLREGPDPCL
ncbi:MAG TPA: V-type ATP synthase subunit D [Candidatus Syntrophosphaera sp.]|nr:V-type ATP synthase subunit D [Candidatus Syntrophosphaera sp.]